MEIAKHKILEPRELWWEKGGISSPAVVDLNGRTHMVYRAIGSDHISRLGLAISKDGENFQQFDEPWFESSEENQIERLGIKDPRVVALGRDIYIIYTATSVYPSSQKLVRTADTSEAPWKLRVSLARTRDFQSVERLGVILPDLDSRSATLFTRRVQDRFWLLHCVESSIFISNSKDLRRFDGGMRLLAPDDTWAKQKVGAACPPIETDSGWLLIYYGVSEGGVYSLGAALLDKNSPGLVLKRAEKPFLKATESWERTGPMVVAGFLLDHNDLSLYYSAGEQVIALAKVKLTDILSSLEA